MSALRQQGHEQMSRAWRTAAAELGTVWCTLMHDSPMWPIHGQYQCGRCGRSCPVLWTEGATLQAPVERIGRSQPIGHSLRSGVLPMVALAALLLVSPIRAADPDTPGIVAGQTNERINPISVDARRVGRAELCETLPRELSSFVEER